MNSFTSVSPFVFLGLPILVAVVIARQLQARPVRAQNLVVLPLVLAVGLTQQGAALAAMTSAGWFFFGASCVAGGVFGALRARTIRTWTAGDGTVWMSGTATTLALWAGLVGFRVLASVAAHFAGVSLAATAVESVAMLAVTFAVQNVLLYRRARAASAAI